MIGRQRVFPGLIEFSPLLRGSLVTIAVAFLLLALGVVSPPARAQEPVPCDELATSLSSEFANSICYRNRFTGSHARGWHEQIHGENSRHLVTVVYAKATDSRSYLRGTNLERLFERFSFPPEMTMLSDRQITERGFEFATIGAPGSVNCVLFLRELRPGRGGYREQQYGVVCDKSHESIYAVGDAEALLSKINFAE